MVITFIGLSGCGKSHLAQRLVDEKGFTLKDCDALIEKKLSGQIPGWGYQGLRGVAEWMGQPHEPRFNETQQKYLQCEREVMLEIIDYLGDDGWGLNEDVVIDTSGSVIYTGDDILAALKKRSRLVYLSIPDSELEFMFEQYLLDPKPVVWGDMFSRGESESEQQALARCYPKLINYRSRIYHHYADVTFIMDRDNRDRFSVQRLLHLAGAK